MQAMEMRPNLILRAANTRQSIRFLEMNDIVTFKTLTSIGGQYPAMYECVIYANQDPLSHFQVLFMLSKKTHTGSQCREYLLFRSE